MYTINRYLRGFYVSGSVLGAEETSVKESPMITVLVAFPG